MQPLEQNTDAAIFMVAFSFLNYKHSTYGYNYIF